MLTKIKDIISLIRIHQWLKNGFVFLPLLFSGELSDVNTLFAAILTFLSFSFIASSIYCFNDMIDVDNDKLHPKKKTRAIASGRISKVEATLVMIILLVFGFAILLKYCLYSTCIVVGLYFLLNLCYCLKLKHIAIVDVFIIALGFVLRVVAGGVSTDIELSLWIILMTFLLALFLAFAKRRDDLVIYNASGDVMRKSIRKYNMEFLNHVISTLSTLAMVCYIMYVVSDDVVARLGSNIYITVIFVIAGFIRYMQATMVLHTSGSPTKVLMYDRFMQVCILAWVVTFMFIIYI